jgi:hypothetical protein
MAENMSNLAVLNYPIEPEWMDPEELKNDPAVLEAALSFRLALAGYDVDPSWFGLTSDPCPVPMPTQSITIPQNHIYINLECDHDVVLYPKPNTGSFNVQIAYYASVTELVVVRNSDQYVAYSKTTPFSSDEPVSFSPVKTTYASWYLPKQFIIDPVAATD